jgi:hypothetical protein
MEVKQLYTKLSEVKIYRSLPRFERLAIKT